MLAPEIWEKANIRTPTLTTTVANRTDFAAIARRLANRVPGTVLRNIQTALRITANMKPVPEMDC